MAAQAGVLSRRQALEHGLGDNDIERLLRRHEWARVYPGVYVDHTGGLTELQRWWAAVQWGWPAVLYGDTALLAHGVRPTWKGSVRPCGPACPVTAFGGSSPAPGAGEVPA